MFIDKPFSAVYVAKPDFVAELCAELDQVSAVVEDLVFSPIQNNKLCFALDYWPNAQVINFESISQAAAILRKAAKFWYLHPLSNVRRSHLILEQVRKTPELSRSFPITEALPPMGCFSLLDKNTLLLAPTRWKAWPLGHCFFEEDKTNPPNRAYLKLWEALTLLGKLPKAGDKAIDLGASPGGWTTVMQGLGAEVWAIDKAPLDPRVTKLPGVHFLQQSAFALDPNEWDQPLDWFIGDIACYPERLLNLVKLWLASGKVKQMVLTIKLQGETDLATLAAFQAIPGGRVLHLYYNKHEATFFYPSSPDLCYSLSPAKIPESRAMLDADFLQQFEACTLPKELFKHRSHLRLAWLYLKRYSAAEAPRHIREAIVRYATSIGAEAIYHESLTQLWVRLIAQAMQDEASFEDFIAAHPELLSKELVQQYYSAELLASEKAKQEWVEPDLKSLG